MKVLHLMTGLGVVAGGWVHPCAPAQDLSIPSVPPLSGEPAEPGQVSAGNAGTGLEPVPTAASMELPGPAEPVELEVAFRPGQTYRFVNETIFRAQLPGLGTREMTVEQQARFDSSARKDRRKGISLQARTERLKIELRSPTESLGFDSMREEDKETPMGRHFRKNLYQTVNLALNADWRVVSATDGNLFGGAATTAAVEEGGSGLPTFGSEELRHIVELLTQGFPEDEVRPGESWTVQGVRALVGSGRLELDIVHRYTGDVDYLGHRCHRIEVRGRITGSMELPDPGAERSALPVADLELVDTVLSGEILLDPAEKAIRYTRQQLNMMLKLPSEPGTPPANVPVEQEVTLSLLQIAPSRKPGE